MAIRSILKLPDPILRKRAKLVERVDADHQAARLEREELGARANGLESDAQLARNAER